MSPPELGCVGLSNFGELALQLGAALRDLFPRGISREQRFVAITLEVGPSFGDGDADLGAEATENEVLGLEVGAAPDEPPVGLRVHVGACIQERVKCVGDISKGAHGIEVNGGRTPPA